jgi:adenylate cyclase
VDGDGRAVLRFRRPLEAYGGHLYPAFSAAAVIHSELRLRDGLEPELDPAELRGSHVLYAAGAAGLHDLRATPVSPLATGAEIHATALDNFLEDAFYRPAPGWVTAALVLLSALLGAFSTLLARSAGRIAVAFAAVLAVPPLAGTVAALLGGWWRIAEPAAAALLALVGGTLARHATEGRRRRFVERAFERYLSPAVIRRLIDDPTRLELGGERRELTIFFSDLAGFSTFAEKLDPRELTALLNDYLSEMTELILDQDGTLDKYEGDAILAFWNAPLDQPDHALRACRAALAGSRRLAELRPRYRRRLGLELRMRVGIHTGPVVVGNMGSRRRFDYTVLGDAANLASRLEGANKAFGTELMVSDECWRRTGGAFHGREIGEVVVVGRRSPVRVFEPLGVAGEPEPPWLADWRQALDDCRNGRYHRALAAFDARAGDGGPRIGDPLAERYAERLRRAIEAGERWDGVWRLESK